MRRRKVVEFGVVEFLATGRGQQAMRSDQKRSS